MQTNSQQQQQQSAVKKQAVQTEFDTQALTLCPNCGAELDEGTLYCPECATPLQQRICPKCGKANAMSSDICQFCKAWLLEKQCKFCYAELDDDAGFCPECGKPKEGISCPHCGNLSIFDFCPKCGKPVTEEAIAEVQTAQAEGAPVPLDPQIAEMEAELARLETLINAEPIPEPAIDDNDVYDPDDDYVAKEPEPVIEEEPVRKSFFSDSQMASIRQSGAAIDEAQRQRAEAAEKARIAEEQRQREAARLAEEKRQRQEAAQKAAQQAAQKAAQQAAQRAADEAERQRQIRDAQAQKEALQQKLEQDRVAVAASKSAAIAQARQNAQKKFATNQEARCWHIARHHPSAVGWLCNYSGCVHLYNPDGGPDDCHDPAQGGCDYFGRIKMGPNGWYVPD
jgi:chemotaxis protein histidine kinase CheA